MYGIILAKTQKSKRLGKIKPFIKIDGVFLIQRMIDEIHDCFEKIIIVTTDISKFKNIKNAEVCLDKYNIGPLGGILTGLTFSLHQYNFVFACDYPFIKKNVVEYMKSVEKNYDILVPKKGEIVHPLFAIYSKNVCPIIQQKVKEKRYKVTELVNSVNTRYVEDIENFDFVFFNLNTKEDLKLLKSYYKSSISFLKN